MAFLAPKTDIPGGESGPQPYNIDGPLPVVFGRQLVDCKLIESPWGHVTLDHGSKLPAGHVYSLAVAVCWGPVERLFSVRINGKPLYPVNAHSTGTWSLAINRNGAHFTDLTYWSQANGVFRNTGKIRIYWGAQDQSEDTLLNGTARGDPLRQPPRNPDLSARKHPPYAGVCYLVFDVLHLDDEPGAGIRGNTAIPVIQAEVFVPPPGDVFAGNGNDRWERGCNPVAITREILRNQIWGTALPDSMLPSVQWDAAAQHFFQTGFHYQTGVEAYLSPQWTSAEELGGFLADWFAYWNAFLKVSDGQLWPGYIPAITQDPGTVTELSRHDCIDEPDIDPQGWGQAHTEVEVKALNVYERLNEETITVRSPYVRRLVEEDRRKKVDAPFVIHPASAAALATRTLRTVGQPTMRIAARVFVGRAKNPDGSLIMPGDLVRFDYAPHALDILCRVVEREDRRGEVRLVMDVEPGRYPEDYIEVVDDRNRPQVQPPEIVGNFRVVELPDLLVGSSWPPQVAILAQRPNDSVVGAEVWLSGSGDYTGEEQLLADPLSVWATRVIIENTFVNADTSVDFSIDGVATVSLFRSFATAEQLNGEMLLIVGNEIMSLGDFSVNASVYTMGVMRGMFGTPLAGTVSAPATGWLISRADLLRLAISHKLFRWQPPYNATTARAWFRLRTYTALEADDQVSSTQFINLRDRTPAPPTGLEVAVNGMDYIISWVNPDQFYAATRVRLLYGARGMVRRVAGTTLTIRGETALTEATVQARSISENGAESSWTTYPVQARNGVDTNLAATGRVKFSDAGDGSMVTTQPIVTTTRAGIADPLRMRATITGSALFTGNGTTELPAYLATRRAGATTWTPLDGQSGRPLAQVLALPLSFGVPQQVSYVTYFAHTQDAQLLFGDPLIEWAVRVPAAPDTHYDFQVDIAAQSDDDVAMPPFGSQV